MVRPYTMREFLQRAQKSSKPFHLSSDVALWRMLEEHFLTWDTASVRRGLESHHVTYLSRRGPRHALWNQTAVCGHHHRLGEHGNLAQVRGLAPDALIWRLGRPELGVWYRNDLRLKGPPPEYAHAA